MPELTHKPLTLNVGGTPVNDTRLGTELPMPIEQYPDFPVDLFVADGMEFVTYEEALEYFVDEDKYFSLVPVTAITAAGQRCIINKHLSISLPMHMTPDQKLVFNTKVREAGYPSSEISSYGEGNCTITLLTIKLK
jgi:hypothetical protein